jgi:uncharacterized protein YlxP (DUF503 family)
MVVGAARVELWVEGSRSLKQKRGVVRSIAARVTRRFNVSLAEVEGQGSWKVAVLGIAAVGMSGQPLERRLTNVVEFIEALHLAEVRDQRIETWDFEDDEQVATLAEWFEREGCGEEEPP